MAIRALNHENDGGAVPFAVKPHEFAQMFRAAFRYRIRKSRDPFACQRNVFYFDETASALALQAQIQAGMGIDLYLAANPRIARELLNGTRRDRFGDQAVRMHRIDADPLLIDFDHLPGVGELAVGVVAARQVNRAPGLFAAQHAAGVGAVRGDDFAVRQLHIGEKALVALDESAADQSRVETHADGYSGSGEHVEVQPALC